MNEVINYFNYISSEIIQNIQNEKAKVIAQELFKLHLSYDDNSNIIKQTYGFDLKDCSHIDQWIKENKDLLAKRGIKNLDLDAKHRSIFNALFELYNANSNLMLLADLCKQNPALLQKFRIEQLSEKTKIFDICEGKGVNETKSSDIINSSIQNVRNISGYLLNDAKFNVNFSSFRGTWDAILFQRNQKLSDMDTIKLHQHAKHNAMNIGLVQHAGTSITPHEHPAR